jgi:hypothetical protein
MDNSNENTKTDSLKKFGIANIILNLILIIGTCIFIYKKNNDLGKTKIQIIIGLLIIILSLTIAQFIYLHKNYIALTILTSMSWFIPLLCLIIYFVGRMGPLGLFAMFNL